MSDLSDFGLRHRTDVAYRQLRAAIHQHVLDMETSASQTPTDMLQGTRTLMMLSQQLKIMSVVKARVVHGLTWAEVALPLGIDESMARKIYAEPEDRWMNGDPEPWKPRVAVVIQLARRIWGGA